MGWRSRTPVIYSRDSAIRSICCIHPWPQAQMDISHQDHPGHQRSYSVTRRCNNIDWTKCTVRHGGLGIINPSHNNQIQHQSSEHITAPLVSLILQQSHTYPQEAKAEQLRAKEQAVKLRKQRDATTATELKDKLPNNMKRAMEASTEKGASSWLATLPITEHGFALHKGAFRDALCLRYGWRPSHLPSHCICGQNFVEHALICSRGGYPSIRHNELRHITAGFLSSLSQCWNPTTTPANHR